MDARSTTKLISRSINQFGARFMLDPVTFAMSVEAGMSTGFASHTQGRIGVMGDVDVELAVESMMFFDPDYVRANWTEPIAITKAEAGAAYAAICAERGRTYLEGFEGAARLAELLEQVADSADDTDAALFAGWRDAHRPEDAEGRAYLMVATIRELRGCRHMSACRAAGADPLAMTLAQSGVAWTAVHGFRDLHAAPADDELVEAVEAATEQADAENYECLTDDERAELIELIEAAVAHAANG
ncbi:MAG TPA: hypothetical protein DGF10_06870 [Acidimicrobiaceae bacterium]|nr:hypothetical protein [Acidimicrobiaceae bacterium]HCV34374.1 hypothetical protein [Acidimicrobiaceae bacterium]|tara:strand:- start:1496 stop:2227 length:732 start_codon:yes stop_codon:yes gene_type:complete